MMALATHQFQGSSSIFSSVPSSCSRGNKLKYTAPKFYAVGQNARFIYLKCRSCLSAGPSLVLGQKSKNLKISAFKGGSQPDNSTGRANGLRPLKNPVKLSYLQHESEDFPLDSSKVQRIIPPYRAGDETTARSLAIQNLFKKWLMVLRTSSQIQPVEKALEEPSLVEVPEVKNSIHKEERVQILKAVWSVSLRLDATIKIPLLIFTPLYLALNLVYVSEVSKELAPLWILGPLITVLYVKMIRAVFGLYLFTFKQTVRVVKNLPGFLLLMHEYFFRGKLIEVMLMHIWKPLADIKNMDYNELSQRKLKEFQVWLVEKYLDFVESIWPYYCRTIRFLKRANLI